MLTQNLVVLVSALAALTSASPVGLARRQEADARLGGGRGGGGGGGFPGRPGNGPGRPGGFPGSGPTQGVTSVVATPTATPTEITSEVVATPTPTEEPASSSPAAEASVTATPEPETSATPTLPSLPGASQLPAPGALALKYVALGHGIQNYTCATAGAAGTATGALAVLYDITDLFPGSGPDALEQAAWDSLTADVLNQVPLPLNLAEGSQTAAAVPPFPAPAGLTFAGKDIPYVAQHFFDATAVPTFDLNGSPDAELFRGAKAAAIAAPSTADAGPAGTGAVAWLQLTPVDGSRGVELTYRVVTAGGNSETCTEVGQQISVPYAAQYWFFA